MKKGQIIGLPILLIFGLIVGAMILFFGIRWIIGLTDVANNIDFLDQVKDLENNIDTFGNYDEGSSKIYTLGYSEEVEKVCFYDSSQNMDCVDDGDSCSGDLDDMFNMVASEGYNLYVIPPNVFDQNRMSIEEFKTVGGNPICVSNGGSIAIVSYGDYVGIEYYE